MCGNNIPLKTKKKKKRHCCRVAPESQELFSGGFWWIFFPPLLESEPDLAVCKHLAGSQKRLILQYPLHGTDCWTKKNLLLLELKSKQKCFSSSLLGVCRGWERQDTQVGAGSPSFHGDLRCPVSCLNSAGFLWLGVTTFAGIPGHLS